MVICLCKPLVGAGVVLESSSTIMDQFSGTTELCLALHFNVEDPVFQTHMQWFVLCLPVLPYACSLGWAAWRYGRNKVDSPVTTNATMLDHTWHPQHDIGVGPRLTSLYIACCWTELTDQDCCNQLQVMLPNISFQWTESVDLYLTRHVHRIHLQLLNGRRDC